MTTECWFPTPIYFSGFDKLELSIISFEIDQVIDDIKNNKEYAFLSDASAYNSKKYNIEKNKKQLFRHFKMLNFIKGIGQHVEEYLKDLSLFDHVSPYQISFTESWLNIFEEDQYHLSHNHRYCDISGVYYHKVPEGSGDIIFETPLPHVETGQFPYGSLCSGSIRHAPQTGKILLFPFWLKHSVSKSNNNFNGDERISIAFNIKISKEK